MRIGSLFSGYGGLSLAVESVFDATTAWVADVEPAACRVLERRFPGVPNLGDVTAVDWSAVEPVDIIEGGSPCQDISAAGKRAGMTDGTRSNLWVAMREAIAVIKPTFVIWENVNGAHSATAASAMEPCPGCVGDGSTQPALRALGRVLGDLAELGFDAEWSSVRASDVGACHQRRRVFILAWHPGRVTGNAPGPRLQGPAGRGLQRRQPARADRDTDGLTLPTPTSNLGTNGGPQHPDKRRAGGHTVSIEDAIHGLGIANRWGQYAAAIARHEHALGRPAPEPTIPAKRGGRKLSGEFTEWMMMLPAGWVWDLVADGTITNNEALKLSGNGVVPPQAAHALRLMLPHVPNGVTP